MVVRKRLPITGPALVFLSTTVYEWLPIFRYDSYCDDLVIQIEEARRHFCVSLVGYVIMPSHLHLLAGFPHIEHLSVFMQSLKSLSSRRIGAHLSKELRSQFVRNGAFQFWKPRFDDLIIVSEEQFRVKLNYIHNNPVKAGLVNNPEDWRYSSAGDWLGVRHGVIEIDRDFKWQG